MEVHELMADMYRLIPEPPHPRQIPPNVATYPFLWAYFPPPPALRTILIQFDGSVEDIQTPTTKEIKASHTYIPGGHQFVTEKDSFAYTALVAAGYTLELIA